MVALVQQSRSVNLNPSPSYLTSVQVSIQQLRDRLMRALGQQPATPTAPVQPRRALPQHGSALPRHPFTPVQPVLRPQAPAAAPAHMPASDPAQQQYYQPVCSTFSLSENTVNVGLFEWWLQTLNESKEVYTLTSSYSSYYLSPAPPRCGLHPCVSLCASGEGSHYCHLLE